MPTFHIVVGAYMLAVYRQVVCRPDCALQPCRALTYDNSRSTAAASVTPAEVMATKACWICSAGSSGSASNLRSIRCVLALSQYAVAKPVNVVAPYRHINEEMAPDFFRNFTGKTRPNNLISISVTISISASRFVGESVCRRIGLSASWFVGELSSYRWLMAFAALANGSLRRLAVRRKLADAHYHRRWCQSHAHCWHCGHAPGTQTEPQLEAATSAGVILPEIGQFLLLCSLQLWQQLQRCQTRARVQVFYAFYFRSTETVHRERYVS